MTKEFNNLEEIQKYYDKKTNTYVFKENDEHIDVVKFNFNLEIKSNIDAFDIDAWNISAFNINADDIKAFNIKAWDIIANDINANNINAHNISYYAVCFAYCNIRCKSIKGEKENHKHFVLDGVLDVEEEI